MKQRILIKKLEKADFVLIRPGSRHDIYSDGVHIVPVPRHREIKEITANEIHKEAGIA